MDKRMYDDLKKVLETIKLEFTHGQINIFTGDILRGLDKDPVVYEKNSMTFLVNLCQGMIDGFGGCPAFKSIISERQKALDALMQSDAYSLFLENDKTNPEGPGEEIVEITLFSAATLISDEE